MQSQIPPSNPTPQDLIEGRHQQLKAGYAKVKEHQATIDGIRRELDNLTKLGDMISPGDVVKAAGKIVGGGVAAPAMAEILSSMPNAGGQPLQEWVRRNEATFTGLEAQIGDLRSKMQHHLGVAGLRSLAAHHLSISQPPTGGPSPQGGETLAVTNPNPQSLDNL